MTGEKRGYGDLRQEEREIVLKRIRLGHLFPVLKAKDFSQDVRSRTTMELPDEVNPVNVKIDFNRKAREMNDSINEALPDREHSYSLVVNRCNSHLHEKRVTSSSIQFASSANRDRVSNYSNKGGQKHNSRDISGRVTTDPLKIWRDRKQNQLVSSSSRYGGIPVPKPREKNDDISKKRTELTKKEEVDRFTKIAAPSGLLSNLNPGIINHVRNSKQVRTIIESLVKSDKLSKQPISVSNSQSAEVNDVSCLAFQAANVASEWLKLLRQDIEGRLIALQRSKNRVREVITIDLPLITLEKLSTTSNKQNAAMHKAKWTKLFDQMDEALSQQQLDLESLLYELKAMQFHCNQGLQHSLDKEESYKKEVTVRAAAASIYSTCKFVKSTKEKNDVPCF